MKLLHTSDWHLGMPLGTDSYIRDQKYFLEWLYEIIESEKIDAVLLAGDVYDSSVANADAINLYNECVTKICGELGVPMVVIAGNHDSGPRLAACSELLQKAGLFVTGKLSKKLEPVVFEEGKVAVYPIPFFNREEARSLFPEKSEEIRSEETAFKVVCDCIREKMDKSAVNIVVAHCLTVNAELSESDRSARVGMATAVSKEVFSGFDYVALGHIHKPQAVSDMVLYSGSPLKYSFGAEEKQEKGVVIFDTCDMSVRFVAVEMLRDRKTVSGTFDEVMSMSGIEDCFLKVEISDRFAGLQLYSELKDRFPFMLELRGKSIEESGAVSSLTAEEMESLDEMGIMKKFMEELFEYEPEERQLSLFEEAMEKSVEEGDLG